MRSSAPSRCNRDLRDYYSYSRKVGTRNAQAIAKLCLAALGKVSDNKIEDVRLAIGSMAVTPLRLRRTEEVLLGQPLECGIDPRSPASTGSRGRSHR